MIEKSSSPNALSHSAAADAFTQALTELTHRYNIGITGSPVLFVLTRDDQCLRYQCDENSTLGLDHAHR